MTEEEKKQRKHQWYLANREKILENAKKKYEADKDSILEYKKKYYQNNREQISEQKKQYRQKNKDKIIERKKQYYQANREERLEYQKQYYNTPIGKAKNLINAYRREDKKHNRGECTLTAEWIVENIFSGQKCIYCGEDDWTKLGCDRIYNDKPHTPDNVVCSCWEHNRQRKDMDFEEFKKMLGESNS